MRCSGSGFSLDLAHEQPTIIPQGLCYRTQNGTQGAICGAGRVLGHELHPVPVLKGSVTLLLIELKTSAGCTVVWLDSPPAVQGSPFPTYASEASIVAGDICSLQHHSTISVASS